MPESNIRHLRRVSPALASYLRVGHRDASLVCRLLEQGFPTGAGVIVDPSAATRTSDLRSAAVEHGVEVILDTRAVELSTVGGFAQPAVGRLPWAGTAPHRPRDLAGPRARVACDSIAATAIEQRVTGVLAPTHLLDDLSTWFETDLDLVQSLRDALDRNGAGTIALYYPLIAPLRLLRDDTSYESILVGIRELIRNRSVDGVFLRVQGFGTTKAGSRNLRTYLHVARALHELGVPVVAERTGCVGVALAAFGAVGGVESSITYGESYDARRLMKRPDGKGFVPPPRVYLSSAMLTLPVDQARAILTRRGFRRLGCQRSCCDRDRDPVPNDPRRHFVVTRAGELADISGVPSSDRAEHYMTTLLRPARDNAAQIARFDRTVAKHRDRLDDWHLALQRTLSDDRAIAPTTALIPTGRRRQQGA